MSTQCGCILGLAVKPHPQSAHFPSVPNEKELVDRRSRYVTM